MGALGVHLIAAIKVTSVDSPLFGIRRLGPPRTTYAVDAEGRHGAASTRGGDEDANVRTTANEAALLLSLKTKPFQRTNHVSQ